MHWKDIIMSEDTHSMLRAAKARLDAKVKGLSGRTLKMRLTGIANRNEIDPVERSLARQTLDFIDLQDQSKSNADAHEELSRNRPAKMSRAEQLAELERLEQNQARLVGQAESVVYRSHSGAIKDALEEREEVAMNAARNAALRAAAEARATERTVDPKAVAALAATLANRK